MCGGGGEGGREVGRSLTSEFLKLPVYMEVKQMETLGCGQPHPPTTTTLQIPKHTYTPMPTHQTSIRKLFFLQLLQSCAAPAFTATICSQSTHAARETFKELILNISIFLNFERKKKKFFH